MIAGSIVALVTPMKADGAVDWASLEKLVAWHIEQGSNGIVAVGTTGESPTLSVEEHGEVIRQTVAFANGRIQVIAGTGANNTIEAIEWTSMAKDVGADACLLVTPYYNRPTQEGLFLHYQAIARAVDIPQILYNVPSRTACDLLPETIERLAQIPNIVGIKEATGKAERARDIIARCPGDFAVVSGDDGTFLDLIAEGGKGNISVSANLIPRRMADICALATGGDLEAARRMNAPFEDLHRDLFVEANPIPVKWAMAEIGLMEAGIRLPLTPLSDVYHDRVRAAMRKAGLLA